MDIIELAASPLFEPPKSFIQASLIGVACWVTVMVRGCMPTLPTGVIVKVAFLVVPVKLFALVLNIIFALLVPVVSLIPNQPAVSVIL